MTTDIPTLPATASLAAAADRLLAERHLGLPVVDDAGRYLGMFGTEDLLNLLVPRVALAGDLAPNLRFVDVRSDTKRPFEALKHRQVGEVVARSGPVLAPDTAQNEAFRIFARSRTPLAVVDPITGKLLGLVTFWNAVGAAIHGPDFPRTVAQG